VPQIVAGAQEGDAGKVLGGVLQVLNGVGSALPGEGAAARALPAAAERALPAAARAGEEVLPAVARAGGEALGARQAAQATPRLATTLGGAAAGGLAGFETTPEEAPLQERVARAAAGAAVGGGLGYVGSGLLESALRSAPSAEAATKARVAARDFDLEQLAQLRADTARRAAAPPPPPGSAERMDWLQGTGKWAPKVPEKPTWTDQVIGVQSANMLSGVGTAVQNVLGNLGATLARPAITAAAGYPMDAVRDVAAMGAAPSDSFAGYGRTFRTGVRTGAKYEANLPSGVLAPLSVPLRNLAATDEFFRVQAPPRRKPHGCCVRTRSSASTRSCSATPERSSMQEVTAPRARCTNAAAVPLASSASGSRASACSCSTRMMCASAGSAWGCSGWRR
jgi:hypothetical protein